MGHDLGLKLDADAVSRHCQARVKSESGSCSSEPPSDAGSRPGDLHVDSIRGRASADKRPPRPLDEGPAESASVCVGGSY